MTNFCHLAVGEDPDGIAWMYLATQTGLYRLPVEEARSLAAQIVRVADLYERQFKVEAVVTFSGMARKP